MVFPGLEKGFGFQGHGLMTSDVDCCDNEQRVDDAVLIRLSVIKCV